MKIPMLLGLALLCASTASAAGISCRVHDGTFDLNDSDFEALKSAFKKPDGNWTSTKEEAKTVFLAKYADDGSTVHASVCQTRMLGRMVTTHQPRAATSNDIIGPNAPYKAYKIDYLADSELDGFNRLLGWAGADLPETPFRNA